MEKLVRSRGIMELYIETLTGTAFELRVSPFETIMSVKTKIQRLEGIPISHQHLIWQSRELEDDFCLHDYNIHSGATLKLVLQMRGGPINTRRIPVEDSALREMAEYMEANREELLEKLPGNSNVTLLVFREGDKLNFFRVVDQKADGSLTPLSECLYPVYNHEDDEDDEDEEDTEKKKEKCDENNKMKEKMDQLRHNMEKISLTRKKKIKTSSGHGHGPHSSVARMRLRGLHSGGRSPSAKLNHTLNKNFCLPPVGHTFVSPSFNQSDMSTGAASTYTVTLDTISQPAAAAAADTESSLIALPTRADKLTTEIEKKAETAASMPAEVVKDQHENESDDTGASASEVSLVTNATNDAISPTFLPHPPAPIFSKDLIRLGTLPETSHTLTTNSARRREALQILETLQEGRRSDSRNSGDKFTSKNYINRKVGENCDSSHVNPGGSSSQGTDPFKWSPISSRKDFVDTFLRPGTTSKRKEFSLESLSNREARAMSGYLRQASIEKIGSSHIGSLASSASKSRVGNYALQDGARLSPQDGRLLSARLRSSTNGERHRLPPVKAKKKQKRCFMCGKKTGLATSYQCRCGNNFCATHRYAESHDCTFDYKTEGRKLLEQSNPLVSAPKLPKI